MRDISKRRSDSWVRRARGTLGNGVGFVREVAIELRKVHWPSWKETRGATVAVLIIVFVTVAYLGLVDWIIYQAIARIF